MIHRLGPSSLYSLELYLQTQQFIQQLMSNCDKPQNPGHLQTQQLMSTCDKPQNPGHLLTQLSAVGNEPEKQGHLQAADPT